MTKMRVLALLAVMVMMLMVPAVASAQQLPPHVFTGTVTVNGLSAPAGTMISAVIDGVQQGSTAAAGGRYVLHVTQSSSGTDISFMVGTLPAVETASWEQGGGDILDLTAGGIGGTGSSGQKGDTGDKGAKGDAGAAGERGPFGPAGPNGADGVAGADGNDGTDGTPGAAGNDGAKGAAGGSEVGLIGLILSIVALLGVAGVYFASRRPA
jgi:collagen type I/II/III/V/XI/XXIV/XXVII alpha